LNEINVLEDAMRVSFKALMAAALLFGGFAATQPTPASAQPYWGHGYRPIGAAYGPRYAARPWVGYRRAYYGPRYGGYPYRYYHRGYGGGAVAAGLIGGLALGAAASAAANPYYYGGYYGPAYYGYGPATYPYGGYRTSYYQPASTCVVERRRIVNRYGRVVVQRVRTCY
jgi:hypothetical protein